jgi:glycerophosphoryl diester phosphodiesterase
MSQRGSSQPLPIAHRACPKHEPENSVAGIHSADELGADMVEIDVRGTHDLERVLMHDRSTRRTAGWGAVDSAFAAAAASRGLSVCSMCEAIRPDPQTARLLEGVVTDWPTEATEALAA